MEVTPITNKEKKKKLTENFIIGPGSAVIGIGFLLCCLVYLTIEAGTYVSIGLLILTFILILVRGFKKRTQFTPYTVYYKHGVALVVGINEKTKEITVAYRRIFYAATWDYKVCKVTNVTHLEWDFKRGENQEYGLVEH